MQAVVRQSPRDTGSNMNLWTTKLVQHFLSTRCGVEYCRERVRQLLHAWGFRLRRLRHGHLKAKPQEQEAFVTDLAILLKDWPEEWERLCVDEATVRRHPTLTAQWCLGDAVPAVPTGDAHTKVQVYGAVAPLTGRTHERISPTLGKGELAMFLRQLARYYQGKHLLIIHDRAAQHRGDAIATAVREAEGRLMLMPQPAYSPEWNPQERLWKWLRRLVTHNHWFATLPEESQAIRDFFCYLAGRKAEVRRLCAIKTPDSLVASL
jgi:DDE superfamily endonuclease/winged helix-turn-helix protein